MKINNLPFATIDWSTVAPTEHPGESGKAFWQTVQAGDIRIRMVEYSPGYKADHWCIKGHVILVLEGELTTELKSGRKVVLSPGMTYHVQDNGEAHRSETASGT